MAYLDHAATTPMRPVAAEAVARASTETWANPSGMHAPARAARRVLDEARDVVAALCGAAPGDVVFTSGGTEADNLAVLGVHDRVGGTLVCSAIEHHAVLDPVCRRGGHTVAVTSDGVVDLGSLGAALDELDDVSLVSVMAVNNEVGTIQPIPEIVSRVRRSAPTALVHVDAVQAPAWLDLVPLVADADLVSLSAHKLGGPKGVGALVVRSAARRRLWPRSYGGGQEQELRPGTQNVAGVAGFSAAAAELLDRRDAEVAHVAALADALVAGLRERVPGLAVTAAAGPRVPGIVHVCVPGVDSELLLVLLDRAGVAASAASSCASGALVASHVLAAMGVATELARGALRLSLGWSSTPDDVAAAVAAVAASVEQLT